MDLILEFIGALLLIAGFVTLSCFALKGFKHWHDELESQKPTEDSKPKFQKVTNIS